jgi:2-phosphosulfolactate phosphatase
MNPSRGRIRFFATAGEAAGENFHGADVVVIDVLRATSTILAALENGAARVLPVESIETATRLVSLSERGDKLLAGEQKGMPIEGFDLFNSPSELESESVAGRTIILATSNGSPALAAAASKAGRLIVCAILNVDAVAEAVSGSGDLVIICSGSSGKVAGEDLLCAGMLLGALSPPPDIATLVDSASLAMLLAEKYGDGIEEYLWTTDRGRQLAGLGYGKDISYCSRRGIIRRVPELVQGLIEP